MFFLWDVGKYELICHELMRHTLIKHDIKFCDVFLEEFFFIDQLSESIKKHIKIKVKASEG